ncbi:MAG: AAA family ATPase [Deltaproteobacteria bacterium]|nr:AAA family ATPase [Myxococcales bacterium]MDP3219325.1 AAA family ATPase [Deltaproteobacteria bacterium]
MPARAAFRPFFTWFKGREDVENERKVAHGDLTLEDPLLRAVRRAVAGMLPDYTGLRVQRDPLQFTVRKEGGETLNLDQLSAGEKGLLALAADIARRLAIAYPDSPDPLAEEGVVLVDEIELHLHPRWQRSVIGSLRRTFPRCQFIVTTHSPQVLSEVPTEAVVVTDRFAFVRPAAPTSGRDTNAILEEVMDTAARPAETQRALDAVSEAIDHEDYPAARAALDRLTAKLSEDDAEIVRLRGLLEFLTAEVVGGAA